MRKFFATLLALVMVLSLMVPAAWAAEEDITILYTNDVHTYIDEDLGYSELAAYKDTFENVLLVDAGDHIQGTAYGSMDKGKTIIDLMNAAGYDLATLGNHEFDYGMEGRINVTDSWAAFPYVSCNFYNELDGVKGETVLDAYKVFEVGGKKIAFIGITTPESFTKSTPAYFQDENGKYIYGIAGGEDGAELYAAVQAAIDAASAEADVVIALGHLGDDPASKPWTSEEVIANTTGLDAFIDGHSHSTVAGKAVQDKGGNDVWLTQTGEYFGAIGKMTIKADGTIVTELVTELPETLVANDAVKAIEDAWVTSVNDQLGVKIGEFAEGIVMDNYDENGKRLVRSQETNTGDFAADALYYLFDNLDYDVDVAIMNGGGVRSKAISGEISYLTCKTIHTFGNVACLQTVTGQQLLDALEWGAKNVGYGENGGFLQVSGIRYGIDPSIPSTVQQDDKGVWTGSPTGDYRVTWVEIFDNDTQTWNELDLEAEYNMAGYNYTLRDLGDGFAMFDGAVNVIDYVMEDYMVLANYVQAFPNGYVDGYNSPLTAKYPDLWTDYSWIGGAGRIEILQAFELNIDNVWADTDESKRPESVTVTVYQNGKEFKDVTVTAADEWKAKLVLPYFSEDGYYTYTYSVSDIEGYKSELKTEVLKTVNYWGQHLITEDETKSYIGDNYDIIVMVDGTTVENWDTGEGAAFYVWTAEALTADEQAAVVEYVWGEMPAGATLNFVNGDQGMIDLGGVKEGNRWYFDFAMEVYEGENDSYYVPACMFASIAVDFDTPVAVQVTVTNTLKAPATGDAGVAIYMVMALVTLCGAAVLVAKKREII